MANPNMADHTYSTAPQSVSRFLASQRFPRSRKVQGRLSDFGTTGFTVRRVLGETTVIWTNDVREYKTDVTKEAKLKAMAKALGRRYEVGRRGDVLIVSERILKPEVLSFHKTWGALGTQYAAETDTHRYVVRRHPQDTTQWELRVFKLEPVGSIDPIMIAGECVMVSCEATRGDAYQAAHEHLKKVS